MFLATRRLHNSGRVALHQCGKPKGLCMMDVRILRLFAFFSKRSAGAFGMPTFRTHVYR